jgi:hypothetical protein
MRLSRKWDTRTASNSLIATSYTTSLLQNSYIRIQATLYQANTKSLRYRSSITSSRSGKSSRFSKARKGTIGYSTRSNGLAWITTLNSIILTGSKGHHTKSKLFMTNTLKLVVPRLTCNTRLTVTCKVPNQRIVRTIITR